MAIDIGSGRNAGKQPGSGARDPWLRLEAETVMTLPLAGQPGHGRTASLRRRPGRIVDGRMEGGNTSEFELICGQCGDNHPYLDYSQIPPRLQRIRGPYSLQAGLAAYERHLGLEIAITDPEHAAQEPFPPIR